MKNQINRRKFLGDCGMMTGVSALSGILGMRALTNVVAAQSNSSPNDYKALVHIYLGGGNDSFNMLRPGPNNYEGYLDLRRQISIANGQGALIKDNSANEYQLHPDCNPLATLWNRADLSFLGNVGPLSEITTAANFANKKKPRGLGSHFDQTGVWQNSIPNERGGNLANQGWIGRMNNVLNAVHDLNPLANVNMSMALGGTGSRALRSSQSSVLSINPVSGPNALDFYQNSAAARRALDLDIGTDLSRHTTESQYLNIMASQYAAMSKGSIAAQNELATEAQNVTFKTKFPDSSLGRQLRWIATLIVLQQKFGLNRQTFSCGIGGFDLHAGLLGRHGGLLSHMSQALLAFSNALKEKAYPGGGTYWDRTVAFTASDFGRNLRSNRKGSDHGWGGVNLITGGPVRGREIIGPNRITRAERYPIIARDAEFVLSGSGRVVPHTSTDEYFASMAHWFGVENDNNMVEMLPGIRKFMPAGKFVDSKSGKGVLPYMFTGAGMADRKIG